MKISCENRFCIYFENNECRLDGIALDAAGQCTSGIHVNIEKAYLARQRKQMLEQYSENYLDTLAPNVYH